MKWGYPLLIPALLENDKLSVDDKTLTLAISGGNKQIVDEVLLGRYKGTQLVDKKRHDLASRLGPEELLELLHISSKINLSDLDLRKRA